MEFSIYQLARQRIAGATIKTKEPKKPREKHEPTPEEIEERKASQRKYPHDWYHKAEHNEKCREWARNNREKWRDEHKDIYKGRKRQKEQKQATNP